MRTLEPKVWSVLTSLFCWSHPFCDLTLYFHGGGTPSSVCFLPLTMVVGADLAKRVTLEAKAEVFYAHSHAPFLVKARAQCGLVLLQPSPTVRSGARRRGGVGRWRLEGAWRRRAACRDGTVHGQPITLVEMVRRAM